MNRIGTAKEKGTTAGCQAGLPALLERFGYPAISLSEPFEDGLALLRVAEQRGD